MITKWVIIALAIAALAIVAAGFWWWITSSGENEMAVTPPVPPWDPGLPGFIAQPGRPLKDAPPSEEQLVALESRIAAKLPPDYRAFLLKANGFDFEQSMWIEFADADERAIEDFDRYGDLEQLFYFSMDPVEFGGLLGCQSMYPYNKLLAPDYFVIGDGWAQSDICLCIRGENYGKVYYHSGEPDRFDTPELLRSDLRYVAPSFRDMWNALKPGLKTRQE